MLSQKEFTITMWTPPYLKTIGRRLLRGIEVPAELSALTDIDPAEVRDPEATGLADADVAAIWAAVEELFRSGMHPMVSLCLRRRGQVVLNRSLGYVSGAGVPGDSEDSGEPVVASLDTPVCLFSASKAVTAMLIHKLAEEGDIDLLAPVSYYIPAFAAKGKSNITVYQLLGHRAGVPGIPAGVPRETLFDHDEALGHICDAEPLDRDGRIPAYHAVTGGFVLAELVRVTRGVDIQQYLDEVVRGPMGMRYFRYGLPPEQRALAARHYATGLPSGPLLGRFFTKVLGASIDDAVAISNSDGFMAAPIASANVYATAEEASRFFQMMIDHGQWQGRQILSPLTVQRATHEIDGARLDKSLMVPMRYSPGMMLGGSPLGLYGADSHYAYGHLGFSNILCWGDPQRDISVALLTSGKPVLGSHIAALLRAVHAISSRCSPCVDMLREEPHFQRV